jgi:hypothetical protein
LVIIRLIRQKNALKSITYDSPVAAQVKLCRCACRGEEACKKRYGIKRPRNKKAVSGMLKATIDKVY